MKIKTTTVIKLALAASTAAFLVETLSLLATSLGL